MITEPVECPHCGRPFVDAEALREHVGFCRKSRQEQLDRDWKGGKYRPEKKAL
jgi:endogenous inhibitor of DNA gyrase (YacG/DUF329 family)